MKLSVALGLFIALSLVGCKSSSNSAPASVRKAAPPPAPSNAPDAPINPSDASQKAADAMADAAHRYMASGSSTDAKTGGAIGQTSGVIADMTGGGTGTSTGRDTTALVGALNNLPDGTAVQGVKAASAGSAPQGNNISRSASATFTVLFGGATVVLILLGVKSWREKRVSNIASSSAPTFEASSALSGSVQVASDMVSRTPSATTPPSANTQTPPESSSASQKPFSERAKAFVNAAYEKTTKPMREFYSKHPTEVHYGAGALATGVATILTGVMAANAGAQLADGTASEEIEVDTSTPAYAAAAVYTNAILCVMSARANTTLQISAPEKVDWTQTHKFCDALPSREQTIQGN